MIVYRITNVVNGKQYIGITRRGMAARWRQHRWDAKNHTKSSVLHEAMRKYGQASFVVEVIHTASTDEEAKRIEIAEIAAQHTLAPHGYNLSPGGFLPGPTVNHARFWLGKKRSLETREKISLAQIGRIPSESTLLASSIAHKGKKLTAEHRAKISAARTGALNPNYGKVPTEEHKARISKALTGIKRSKAFADGIRERMRANHPGAILSVDKVRAIRTERAAGEMGKTLAIRYGVSQQTISLVCNGTRWGHVT